MHIFFLIHVTSYQFFSLVTYRRDKLSLMGSHQLQITTIQGSKQFLMDKIKSSHTFIC